MNDDRTLIDAVGDAMAGLPEEIATQWHAHLGRDGMTAMGELFLRVLMHAEQRLDYDALTLLLQGAAQRIAYQGPDRAPLDLSTLVPSAAIYRYTRKLVQILTEEAGLTDVPGGGGVRQDEEIRAQVSAAFPAALQADIRPHPARHRRGRRRARSCGCWRAARRAPQLRAARCKRDHAGKGRMLRDLPRAECTRGAPSPVQLSVFRPKNADTRSDRGPSFGISIISPKRCLSRSNRRRVSRNSCLN
jgi:hypothetical protein